MTTTTERTIRPARAADLAEILALVASAGLPTEGIAGRLEEGYAVATLGDRLLGVAGVERYGRWGLLRSVAVAAEARGSGLGMELSRERLAWAQAHGLDAVYLLTTTAEDFFPRLGFQRIARDEVPGPVLEADEFRSICPSSAVVMVRLPGEC